MLNRSVARIAVLLLAAAGRFAFAQQTEAENGFGLQGTAVDPQCVIRDAMRYRKLIHDAAAEADDLVLDRYQRRLVGNLSSELPS